MRNRTPIVSIASILLCLSASAFAQEGSEGASTRQEILLEKRKEKARQLTPYETTSAESRVRGLEKAKFPQNILVKGWHGIRPVIGGMPPGSGFVGGAGYVHGLENQYFTFQTNARYSTRGYTILDAEGTFPPPQVGRRVELRFKTEYRDLTSLRFFGLGNESSVDDRSTYLMKDTGAHGFVWLNPRGLLSFGAQTGWLRVETGAGSGDPSLESVFSPETVPGFGLPRTEYHVTGGWAEFDLRHKWEEPAVGVVGRITVLRHEDFVSNRFDFTRVVGDVKAYIPLGRRNRILALRFRTSHAESDDGHEVPFYMMETLGGSKTIRSYREYRFRDLRNLLLQAEYRWEVWTYVDFTFFFDAGKVFSDRDDFNFSHLHTGYGFGVRAHAPGGFALRIDLARGSEGVKLHISGGPSF